MAVDPAGSGRNLDLDISDGGEEDRITLLPRHRFALHFTFEEQPNFGPVGRGASQDALVRRSEGPKDKCRSVGHDTDVQPVGIGWGCLGGSGSPRGHAGQGLVKMHLTTLTSPVPDAVGRVAWGLEFGDHDASTQSVTGPTGQHMTSPWDCGDRMQEWFEVLPALGGGMQFGWGHSLRQAGVQGAVWLRVKDQPSFVLFVGPWMVGGEFGGGMHLNGKISLGIKKFHQQRETTMGTSRQITHQHLGMLIHGVPEGLTCQRTVTNDAATVMNVFRQVGEFPRLSPKPWVRFGQ